jgi:hypothetical protein
VAPEVLDRPAVPRSVESDLYAVGAVTYFCLVGHEPPHDPRSRESRRQMEAALAGAALRHRLDPAALGPHVLRMLAPDPSARPHDARAWARELERLVRVAGRRRRRGAATAAAAAAILGAGALWAAPGGPDAAPTVLPDFSVFGATFADVTAEQDGDRLVITPPLGRNRYEHLWGAYAAGDSCAATVEFDVQFDGADRGDGFGVAVAPRSTIEVDQPYGYSVQYEWTPDGVGGGPGSHIRPAELPGGAWTGTPSPVDAPDVGSVRHVVVRAVGTDIQMTVDGVQARFAVPAVECGGIAIRAWGAPVRITNLHVDTS